MVGMPRKRTLALAAATVLTAVAAAADATVNVIHSKLPAQALALDPEDPVALVRDAQLRIASGEGFEGGTDTVFDIARRSVISAPINPAALRLSGVVSSANSDLEGVRRQMALSDRMGRRDLASQLWLIEDAVLRNDVDAALRHYDTALRVQESSRALLYPVLTNALDEPIIRARFMRFLREKPEWLESFFRFALSNTDNYAAIADMVQRAGGFPDEPAFSSFNTELMRALVEQDNFDAAAKHFLTIEGADPRLLTSLALSRGSTSESLAPATWQSYSIPGITAYVVATSDNAVEVENDIEAGFSGPVIRKLLQLQPGRYRLTSGFRAANFGPRDVARWSMVCGSSQENREIFSATENLAQSFSIDGSFTVPAGCSAQMLTLSTVTNPVPGAIELEFVRAGLTRLGSE